ncbi:MAG: bifunctional precorrin-2 dehydrogenase/sirohydrochlorin ferrochelatase [Deltaproteobacteria bacterium]|jgi:precorrin-2 dehydrogenase/sirohydrochlorin ferrochelatase|nr:bifunctional precorrin-2 dehydrogenase/sirohydrochlorin ferrochelatase [Deltaproteobacteria bacterium]
MSYYPLLLNLSAVKILLAGAGEVGRRKAVDILACAPAELLWVDPEVSFAELLENMELSGLPGLKYEQRPVQPEDVEGKSLVFAATGSREVNRMLADVSAGRGIFCNVVDAPAEGTFFVPAHFSQGDILFALSTGGLSPALSRRLREELQEWLGEKYTPLLTVMGRIRPLVLGLEAVEGMEKNDNVDIFRNLVNSNLAAALANRDLVRARALLIQYLPLPLHSCIGDILYEPF